MIGGTIALVSLAGLLAMFHLQGRQPAPGAAEPPLSSQPPLQVYFTEPGDAVQPAEAELVRAIDEARFTIDVASYNFNLWSVRQALLRAWRRGVEVRVLVDSDHLLEPEVGDLIEGGIPVLGDGGPGLMHHKFVVIDGLDTWTGSMNLTYGSARVDHNNWMRLRSKEVAQDFRREFEEMVLEQRFGPASRADTPHPYLLLNGTEVEVLFSPDDRVAARLVSLLRGARQRIDVMAYSFTSDALGEALVSRAQDGVNVRGVFDQGQATASGAEFSRLRQAGLDVRLDQSEGLLHHKVIVIDGETVVTGSYNFTRSAEERNDEAILILRDPDLAQRFLSEFERLYRGAESSQGVQPLGSALACGALHTDTCTQDGAPKGVALKLRSPGVWNGARG
jgi:phosphatidylserine/phosphatidylglycerophosphate/cardiolipin synthase-like enzyme